MTPDVYSLTLFYGIVVVILAVGSGIVGFKLYSNLRLKEREVIELNFELERFKEKVERMDALEANIGMLESKL